MSLDVEALVKQALHDKVGLTPMQSVELLAMYRGAKSLAEYNRAQVGLLRELCTRHKIDWTETVMAEFPEFGPLPVVPVDPAQIDLVDECAA